MEGENDGQQSTPRLDFKEIIGLNVAFMQAFGNYVPDCDSVAEMVLYVSYAVVFVGVIFVGMLISEVVNMILALGDMEKATEASFLTLTHVVQVGKFYYLYTYHSKVKTLVLTINRDEFQPKTYEQYAILSSYIDDSKKITKIFLSACIVTCSFWGMYPFTIGGDLFLPLAGWFSFDTTQSPMFEIAYTYQMIAGTLNGLSNVSLDTFMSDSLYTLELKFLRHLLEPHGTMINEIGKKMDFKEIVTLNIKVLNVFGYISPEFESGIEHFLFAVRSIMFVGLVYIGMLISEVINMILVAEDMEKLTEASFLALTHLVEICKVYAIIKYRDRLKQFIHSINRVEFQPRSRQQYEALQNYIHDSKMISKMFLTACILTCAFWGVYPLVDKGGLHLPLAGWFPFDTSCFPWFEIAYGYQVVGSTINGLVNVSLDTFMSGLIMVVCAQLNILNDSLKNLREHSETELRNTGIEVGHAMTKQLQDKMNEKFLECVAHHRHIIDFANEVTFLFTTSILGQFVVSVIIICITLFEITLLPVISIKFFSMILYQFCMLLEIFLLCYYGNEVIRESTELTKFAYCSDWMECSPEFKRNLVFFMTRSQKALRLYAGGFFTLSLETFVKILKSSWSYFAVLNSVHSEK